MPRIQYSSPAWVNPFYRYFGNGDPADLTTSRAWAAVGRVYLAAFHVPTTLTLDMLGYLIGDTSSGNVRMALYHRGSAGFPDLPDAGALIVETGSLAQPGTNRTHVAGIADTQLTPGGYYFAVQADDLTGTMRCVDNRSYDLIHDNVLGAVQPGRSFDQAYAAFTDPCPVTANDFLPRIWLRVASVP